MRKDWPVKGAGQGLSNSLYRLVYSQRTPAVSTYGRAKCNFEQTTIADHLHNELVLTKKRAPRPFSTYQ